MNVNVLVAAMLLGQTPANLDFSQGKLTGWEGSGFAFAPASNGRPAGAWSKDEPSGKGMIRFAFVVPAGARQITFQAFADVLGDNEPDHRLNVVLAGADNTPAPRVVKAANGAWQPAPKIALHWVGKPKTYAWDVTAYQGKLVQIVLADHDPRPGHYLWAGDFKIVTDAKPGDGVGDAEFASFMLDLQRKNNLAPMAKFDSKRFTAVSNASDKFTTERLQNCEVFYDLFLDHFKAKGFPVHPPAQRMMIAVFDTHEGFDAYFGRRMPSGIAGVYHPGSNRLILYDYAENRGLLANKEAAIRRGDSFGSTSQKSRYVETVERKLSDVSKDANLSTTMHECAHQISFNCGLLTRKHDVPACIAEGLATYCEATDEGDWTSLGGLNPMRINGLARARGQFIPLTELLGGERWLQTKEVYLGYSQSWALFHFLMHRHPRELQKYMALIEPRRTPENRLGDFQEAFGNIADFERRYHAYIGDIIKNRPTVAR